MATRAETAKNTRAVASQRSVRRTSLGSAAAWGRPIKRWLLSAGNQVTFRRRRSLSDYGIVSHIIDKKDRGQVKV